MARVVTHDALAPPFGDTPYDAEAAQRSHVAFIGFTCGGHAARALAGARAIYRDPEELVARFADSPLAR